MSSFQERALESSQLLKLFLFFGINVRILLGARFYIKENYPQQKGGGNLD